MFVGKTNGSRHSKFFVRRHVTPQTIPVAGVVPLSSISLDGRPLLRVSRPVFPGAMPDKSIGFAVD